MMSLLQTIKRDQMQARKDKQAAKVTLLTTFYSEAANVGLNDGKRESTDAEVVATAKKFIKNIDETLAAYDGTATALLQEKQWLESYLPSQLSEAEITDIVKGIIAENDGANMGVVMKALKDQYAGQYDGRVASTVVKGLL
jgi:uncharacterized protein YqeY